MVSKKTYFFISTIVLTLSSCVTNYTIKQSKWLTGTWVQNTSKGPVYETWEVYDKKELRAKSYRLNGQDTSVLETVRLQQVKSNLYYIPTVVNQNDGQAIVFQLTHQAADSMRFENPDHDFPQVISYLKINNDSLAVVISGKVKQRVISRTFPMRRID